MHRLIKIRIIRDFEHLEERWRCQPDIRFESTRAHIHFCPAADFYETAQGLVIRLELAGVKPDSLSISLAGTELVVTGRRQPPPRQPRNHKPADGISGKYSLGYTCPTRFSTTIKWDRPKCRKKTFKPLSPRSL